MRHLDEELADEVAGGNCDTYAEELRDPGDFRVAVLRLTTLWLASRVIAPCAQLRVEARVDFRPRARYWVFFLPEPSYKLTGGMSR